MTASSSTSNRSTFHGHLLLSVYCLISGGPSASSVARLDAVLDIDNGLRSTPPAILQLHGSENDFQ